MVAKYTRPIEPGTYLIQSVASSKYLNLVCHETGQKPTICIWRVFHSPTQRWIIEAGENGYFIKNAATDLYLAFEGDPDCHTRVIGISRPTEWRFEQKADSQFEIRLASKGNLGLDISGGNESDGNHAILYTVGGYRHQCFTFHRVDDQPPSYNPQSYIGPVPAGIYWIGQPSENGGPGVACKAASSAGLSASVPSQGLTEGLTVPVHLSAVGSSPLPSQIWSFECGIRGYRIKHIESSTYLNLVNREPVLEPSSLGPTYSTEWQLERRDGDKLPCYFIRPIVDLGILLGVTKGDSFNRLRAKSLPRFYWEMVWAWVYAEWRLEAVDEATFNGIGPSQ